MKKLLIVVAMMSLTAMAASTSRTTTVTDDMGNSDKSTMTQERMEDGTNVRTKSIEKQRRPSSENGTAIRKNETTDRSISTDQEEEE